MQMYTTETEKDKEENADKVVLSTDAFAICEFLEELSRTIRIGGLR